MAQYCIFFINFKNLLHALNFLSFFLKKVTKIQNNFCRLENGLIVKQTFQS